MRCSTLFVAFVLSVVSLFSSIEEYVSISTISPPPKRPVRSTSPVSAGTRSQQHRKETKPQEPLQIALSSPDVGRDSNSSSICPLFVKAWFHSFEQLFRTCCRWSGEALFGKWMIKRDTRCFTEEALRQLHQHPDCTLPVAAEKVEDDEQHYSAKVVRSGTLRCNFKVKPNGKDGLKRVTKHKCSFFVRSNYNEADHCFVVADLALNHSIHGGQCHAGAPDQSRPQHILHNDQLSARIVKPSNLQQDEEH